jgi:hypothetical protein
MPSRGASRLRLFHYASFGLLDEPVIQAHAVSQPLNRATGEADVTAAVVKLEGVRVFVNKAALGAGKRCIPVLRSTKNRPERIRSLEVRSIGQWDDVVETMVHVCAGEVEERHIEN